MIFEIQHRATKSEIDALDIVFFPNYADWIATCFLAYLKKQCVSTRSVEKGYEVRVVSIKINYISSVYHNDLINISIKDITYSSPMINFMLVISMDKKIIVKAKLSAVYVDYITKQLIPIPEDVAMNLK